MLKRTNTKERDRLRATIFRKIRCLRWMIRKTCCSRSRVIDLRPRSALKPSFIHFPQLRTPYRSASPNPEAYAIVVKSRPLLYGESRTLARCRRIFLFQASEFRTLAHSDEHVTRFDAQIGCRIKVHDALTLDRQNNDAILAAEPQLLDRV